MSKFRSYSIVLHNVKDDSKSSVENHFKASNPIKLLVALESYPESEGYHIHVFVSYKSQRSFKSVLSATQSLSEKIVAPRPDGETRAWGRVQVDKMRGTFEQATAYLVNPDKDKPLDPNVQLLEVERQRLVDDYFWSDQQLSRLFVSSFTNEFITGRSIIKEYEERGLPLPIFWTMVKSIWERGLPTFD